MKKHLHARRFVSSDEVKAASQETLREVTKNASQLCSQKLSERWQKGIVALGDYFEGGCASVVKQTEKLTTELASTTNQNIVIACPPTENLLNAPTPNSNAPKPNYVPPPIMLKVTETYKQQMKVITNIYQQRMRYLYPRYGYNSQNTLDIALTGNFNFPFTIASLAELSSDHNPVLLNFSFITPIHQENPRAITTRWPSFMQHLNNNIHLENYTNINNPVILENKITNFSDAVCSAHSTSSQPNRSTRHTYTPSHIRDLISRKKRSGKLFQTTLNPIYKTETNRLQAQIKRELKKHKTHGKLNL
ncbi:putative RNA-directed DNA polymerase from transposon X-element [Trichonephila clavipes]|nr:putative RNA-directed DNA polymerase from transposon X-element [Trichonephila clavipes]